MKKLAIVVTHPIQYYTPVFRLLAQRVNVKVYYTWGQASVSKFDPGFGKTIQWDIDLLDGYSYEWQENTAKEPGSHKFYGITNPHLIDNLTTWQPDAILIYGWAYNSHLKVMRHFKNKLPIFFRGDSTLLDEKSSLKATLKYFFLKWVYRHVDHAFYTGTNNKSYFEKYGLNGFQLSFAPHSVDNGRFAMDRTNEATALRQRLGLTAQDQLILFAGKFEDKKDPLLLLNAFTQINNTATHLLFVGNGGLEDLLKSAANTNPNIHFLPFQNQSQMPVIYQAADVFCLPSKGPGETWGLAVNEAMACGKAVLVSDKCGCGVDLVHHNKNGYIFKSGDSNELLTCLKLLITDKNKLIKFGENSNSIIEAWNFSSIVGAIVNKLHEKK